MMLRLKSKGEIIMLSKFKIKIVGVTPLLMHSCRMANPLDEYSKAAKAISSKHHSKKTDEDHVELSKIQFIGSSYYDTEIGYYMPAENIEACIRNGARVNKNGKNVVMAVKVLDSKIPLITDTNNLSPDKLFENQDFVDVRFVNINKAKVLCTRPRFERWECEFEVEVDTDILTIDEFIQSLDYAGSRACLGDYRPRYGRFECKVEQLV